MTCYCSLKKDLRPVCKTMASDMECHRVWKPISGKEKKKIESIGIIKIHLFMLKILSKNDDILEILTLYLNEVSHNFYLISH